MSDDDRLLGLLLRWEEAYENGRDVAAEELCRDCPELAGVVAERMARLQKVAWVNRECGNSLHEESAGDGPATGAVVGGRYRLDARIAEGGFGEVWRAFDLELRRFIAVKVPKQSRFVGPERIEGLLAEARKAASLKHPGIVPVFDVARHNGVCFIVSELVEGEDLVKRLRENRFPVREAVRIVAEVARHLHYAHEQGFIHRDIKPANILLDGKGRVFLTDFGIAVTVEDQTERTADGAGTPAYMSPEQLCGDGSRIDRRTDIYSLGAVLYELLTGKAPFREAPYRPGAGWQGRDEPPPPRAVNPATPGDIERICLKCLATSPADRYATAGQLADELGRAAERPWGRYRLGAAALLLCGLIAVVFSAPRMASPPGRAAESPAEASASSFFGKRPLARKFSIVKTLADGSKVILPESQWDKRPLLNGKDLGGWLCKGTPGDGETPFRAAGDELICNGVGEAFLRTEGRYGDLLLRCDYRRPAGPQSGGEFLVLPRMGDDRPLQEQTRLLIGDSTADLFTDARWKAGAQPYRFYDLRQVEKAAGEWNQLQVYVKDGSIDVDVNSCRVLKGVGVLHDKEGHIGLKAIGGEIQIRRPYEVAIRLEYSGSMNNESDKWNCMSYMDLNAASTAGAAALLGSPMGQGPEFASVNYDDWLPLPSSPLLTTSGDAPER